MFHEHSTVMSKGDLLLGSVASGSNGDTEYELLKEFVGGYPIEKLSLLLVSERDSAVKAGAWIASELGRSAESLLDELTALLNHRYRDVRFFAADGVLLSAGTNRGDVVAEVIKLIDDPDEAVRWRVMKSLVRAERAQLVAAMPHLEGTEVGGLVEEVLLGPKGAVLRYVQGTERQQRCAAVAAGRLALAGDTSLLSRIASAGHPEMRQFAGDLLELIPAR